MSSSACRLNQIARFWNWFFFQSIDSSICGLFRIAYCVLLIISLFVQLPDVECWFGQSGVLSLAASRNVIDQDRRTVFEWLPQTQPVLWACYTCFLAQSVLLLLGLFTRFQAISVFFWLVSFHHRNILLFDGEDVVFRMLAFFLIFFPQPCPYSVDAKLARRRSGPSRKAESRQCWALRLIQIQMTLIYLSSVWTKFNGESWLDGTALFYVSRLDDMFGRFPVPESLFQHLGAIRVMTWSVLLVESFVAVALWIHETRRWALLVAIGFHLIVDYTMNLFLFQWIMIVGLLAFAESQDFRLMRRIGGRFPSPTMPD